MDKRNWKIYFEWIEGKDYKELAIDFNLSEATIKEICTSKVPPKIRQTPWQTANQYKKWREFVKRRRMSASDTSTGRSSAE